MTVFILVAFALGALHVVRKLVVPFVDKQQEIGIRERLGIFVDQCYPPVHIILDAELVKHLCIVGNQSL